jgi:hypothetical protein
MDVDIHMAAVHRYGALIGDFEEPSQAELVQALADREFLSEYIPKGPRKWDKPTLLLRFMHEICDIPLWQARECAIIVIKENRGHEVFWEGSIEVAIELMQETGNVLIAEATASLYLEASEGCGWWKDVLEALRYGEIVEVEGEDTSGPDEGCTLH